LDRFHAQCGGDQAGVVALGPAAAVGDGGLPDVRGSGEAVAEGDVAVDGEGPGERFLAAEAAAAGQQQGNRYRERSQPRGADPRARHRFGARLREESEENRRSRLEPIADRSGATSTTFFGAAFLAVAFFAGAFLAAAFFRAGFFAAG